MGPHVGSLQPLSLARDVSAPSSWLLAKRQTILAADPSPLRRAASTLRVQASLGSAPGHSWDPKSLPGLHSSDSPRQALSGGQATQLGQQKEEHTQDQRQQQQRVHAGEGSTGREATRTVVKVQGLRADDIRHPLDRQNTALMRAVPGLNELGRMLLGPVQEQILVLENLGSGIHVTQNQLPALHSLMLQAAELLQMPAPDLYIRQSPVPNAYTLAINGKKPFVVVHTALLDLLTPAETQAVLAHELGHLKCDHGIWLTFANLIALGAYSIPGGLGSMIASSVEEQLMRWLRAAELTCDRAALVVTQDARVVVSALMKLAGGSSALAHELSVDAFLEQARSYDEAASSSPLAWYLRHAQTRQLSHPLPVLRAREVDRWARSAEFKTLLDRGTLILPQHPGSAIGTPRTSGISVSVNQGTLVNGRSGSGVGGRGPATDTGEKLSTATAAFRNRGTWWFVNRDTRW